MSEGLDFSWKGGSPSGSPLVEQSGEFGLTGGGLALSEGFVVGLLSGARCGLVALLREEFHEERGRCGAHVGTGERKMCVRQNCTIGSHRLSKALALSDQDWFGSDPLVVIKATAGSDESSVVFVEPRALGSEFGDALEESLVGLKPLVTWQTMFGSLRPELKEDTEKFDEAVAKEEIVKRLTKEVRFEFTPKRRRLDPRGSPDSMDVELLSLPAPPAPSDGASLGDLIQNVQECWVALESNFSTLHGMTTASHNRVRGFKDEADEEAERLDLKVSQLSALLGKRTAAVGTTTAFEWLNQLEDKVQDLRLLLDGARNIGAAERSLGVGGKGDEADWEVLQDKERELMSRLETGLKVMRVEVLQEAEKTGRDAGAMAVQDLVFKEGCPFRVNILDPTAKLLRSVSSSPSTPGDLLNHRLIKLEHQVGKLMKRTDPTSAASSTGGRVGTSTPDAFGGLWGSSSASTAPSGAIESRLADLEAKVSRVGLSSLTTGGGLSGSTTAGGPPVGWAAELNKLKVSVGQLEDQVGRTFATVAGVTFKSPSHVKSWLTLAKGLELPILFVDAISLLSLSDNIEPDEKGATRDREMTARTREKSPEHAKLMSSFALEVPPMFGRSSDPNTTSSDRALTAVPKFSDWDTGLGRDGVKQRLERSLRNGKNRLSLRVSKELSGEAQIVANALLTSAHSFWIEFTTWISTCYRETLARSSASEKEVWILVSHCVRAVFAKIRQARLEGTSRVSEDMVWAAMQAQAVMDEFVELGFQGHQDIATILHSYLIDHSTPVSRFESLLEQVRRTEKIATEAKKTADRALSKK